jgi:hypothetical protein
MTKLGGTITKGVTKLAQDVAKGIGATVVDTTRVDTGLARSNWRATISAPASGIIPPFSPGNKLGMSETANAGAAKAFQKQHIERFDASKHVSIFITNNVPYIGILNNGGRNVAPGLMVEQGLQTGKAILQAKAGKVLSTR